MRSWSLILLISGLVLAGCAPPEDVVTVTPRIVPTATAVVTAIPSPQATSSSTQTVIENVVEDTAVNLPTATPLPSQIPIPTPPLLLQQIQGKEFQLHMPDSEILVQILAEALAQQKAFDELPGSAKSAVVEADFTALFRLIANDSSRYYPKGFAASETIVKEPHEVIHHRSDKAIWTMWQAYVLQLLNENQVELDGQTTKEIPYASLIVQEIEQVSGNDPAWLLFVVPVFQSDTPLFWPGLIPVIKRSGTEYVLAPHDLTGIYFPEYTNILTDYDLTGDGQKDVIVEIGSNAGDLLGHQIEVYSWNAPGLFLLATIDAYDGKYAESPQIEIADYNQDGITDIRVTHHKWMDLGCRYEEVDIYSWPGGESQHIQTSTIEGQPECDAARAVTQNLSSQSPHIGDVILSPENLSMDERIALLNRSLANTTIDTAPFSDYIALLRLHLAMAYLSKGESELASTTMASISELPNTEFTTNLQEVNLATEGDLVSTCRLLYQNEWFRGLDMAANEDLLSQLGMLRNYGYPTTALQRRMCPFPMVITGLLDRLELTGNLSPENAFAENDIEILFQQEFNLDNDAESEWLVVVEPAAPQVVILDLVDNGWQLHRLAELIPPVTDFQAQVIQGTPDDYPVLLVQATQNIWSWFCWGDQQTDILTVDLSAGMYEVEDRIYACANDSLPLYSDKLSNPFYEAPLDYFFLQKIDQWEEEILSGKRPLPDLQDEVNDLISKLPNDTTSRQMMHNRLLYLSGLTYELDGKENQAVATYLTLIQQAPSSPWAWLSWARLEPVEP
ncbi:MAG TPA: VCBS repeat-containing protein [Chloroflexota bacterium]|nr:VCBS repeat-containing protein [Chloroflexota bacterium]HUM68503.1 VCBS repeat-containing protein [Chloroflexota bacterium]